MKSTYFFLILIGLISLGAINHKYEMQPEILSSEEDKKSDFCKYHFSREQLVTKRKITIFLYEKCDSMEFHIPSGFPGSSARPNSAGLYKDSTRKELISIIPSCMQLDQKRNFMTVSTKLKGDFFLFYSSGFWTRKISVTFK